VSGQIAYRAGLHELGDGIFAYLQPDGGWGWSNAGLVTADDTSLLIDTLFDLNLTRAMLDSMRPITESSPIGQAMNTHGDGDHWYGNQLLPDGIPIVATASAIEEMRAAPPRLLDATVNQLELGPEFEQFVSRTMRRFDFQSISERLPNESFEGTREMSIGMRRADLIELGPAHTAGDAIVHIPDAGVLFTGDLLFIEGTPIIWEGPVSNWLAACDSIIDLGAEVLVPGHGPVTDESGVADVQRYLRHVRDEPPRASRPGWTRRRQPMTSTSPTSSIGPRGADRRQRRGDLPRARPVPAGPDGAGIGSADGRWDVTH